MKNKLIYAALRILPKKRPRARHILAISTTALGDSLWATPAIESLRHSFPTTPISVLTSQIGEEVLRHNPWTDNIYVANHFFSAWKNLPPFSDVVLLHASQRWALPLARLLGAARIVGTTQINKGLDSLLTDPLDNRYEHEIVRRLQLVEQLGAKRSSETLSFFLQPDERMAPLATKTVALHPGSKDLFKRWPKEHFIEVGNFFQKQGWAVTITGTEKEEPLLAEIAGRIQGASLYKSKSLRALAAYLERAALLISNDTGPVHLACALQTPVVAIYSATDPKLCGPHQAKKAAAVSRPPTCDPCLKKKCRIPFCLLQISPKEVIESALRLIPL